MPPQIRSKGYEIKAKANKKAEVWLYEEIGYYGVSAKRFSEDIKNLGDIEEITLRINSPGGDVFDGNAIYNILKQHKAKVVVSVDGLAASAASVIAMSGDEIFMAANSMMMVHDPWTIAIGYAADLRKTADMLEKIAGTLVTTYAKRTGLEESKVEELMAAETWMTAEEAKDYGFADGIVEAIAAAAHFDLAKFKYRKAPTGTARAQAAIGRIEHRPVHLNPNPPGASGILERGNTVKTIAEQIAAFEAKRAANMARLTEIMNAVGEEGRTLNETEQQEYDGLQTEVKSIDEHLVRLREHERQMVAAATAVSTQTVITQAAASTVRAGTVKVKGPNLPPGTAFVRYAMALMGAVIDKHRRTPVQIAQDQRHWKDTTPQVEAILQRPVDAERLIRAAATTAGDTTADGWATELADYTYMASEFIEFLRPQTIIGKIPGLRTVPFNIRMPLQDAGSSVNWVGEGLAKPVSKLHFDTMTLRFAKAAGIVVLTDELIRFSNPSAEAVVRTDMAAAIRQFLDEQFVNPAVAAVTNVSPASITNGAGHAAASGTGADDFRNDLTAALQVIIAANIEPSELVIVMTPALALQLSMIRNLLGQKEFPEITANGGSIEGYLVVTSGSIPSGDWLIAKPSEILLADDGGIAIDASREASITMDDGTSPASTTVVNLFQNNMVALRVERVINWARRRLAAVYYFTGANYGGGSPA